MEEASMRKCLLNISFLYLMLTKVTDGSPRHGHRCTHPDSIPTLPWEQYEHILINQTQSLLFGDEFESLTLHAASTTRQQVHVVRAICDLRFSLNTNPLRRPATLMESTCDQASVFSNGRLYVCKPLAIYVSVLWRGACVRGTFVYSRSWEKIHVGCAAYAPTGREVIVNGVRSDE